MKRTLVLPALLVSLLVTSCGSEGKTQSLSSSPTPGGASAGACVAGEKGTKDMAVKPVPAYLKDPEPTVTTIHEVVCGTGAVATDGSNVEVKYVGVLFKDGKEFDSSWSRGTTSTLPFQIGGGVIPGFSKGTLGMRVGGRREVVIPSDDGYGPAGSGPIPPAATLVFLIDLVKVG